MGALKRLTDVTTTFNLCLPLFKIAYTYYRSYINHLASITQISPPASLKSWHKRLGHLSYANFKRFGNTREIDMSKMKVNEDVFFSKTYIKAKQKRRFSYKIQHPLEDICKELHVDLIEPIISTGWKRHKYSLTIRNGYSRY